MAFIGNSVQNQGFTPAIDYFSGNGSTVTFTLSRNIASVAQVICAIDNVIQNPSSAYTVSGNAITFTSAPLSGTNNIWVEYTSLITTYAAISQSPSVIGDITASGGYLAVGSFGNSFIDGTVVDYVTGNGRITVGSADGFTLYNGGTTARSALASWTQTGALTLPADATINGLTVGKGGGAVSNNTALGVGVLQGNSSGGSSTGVGYQALYSATQGAHVAIGQQALYSNTTGTYNTAIGYQAGYSQTTGNYNTCIGGAAGYTSTGNNNTLIGFYTGYSLTTGNGNTFIGNYAGYGSGYYVTTGSKNTIIGGYSGNQGGLDIRTSSNNIVLSDGDGGIRYYDNATTSFIAGAISTQQGNKTSIGFPFGVFGGGLVSGTSAYNTNITINQGGGAACALLMISSNGGAGTTTRNAVYSVQFYYDGSNTPTLRFISGSHDYITAGQSGGTLTLTSGYSGNHYYSWWINKP